MLRVLLTLAAISFAGIELWKNGLVRDPHVLGLLLVGGVALSAIRDSRILDLVLVIGAAAGLIHVFGWDVLSSASSLIFALLGFWVLLGGPKRLKPEK